MGQNERRAIKSAEFMYGIEYGEDMLKQLKESGFEGLQAFRIAMRICNDVEDAQARDQEVLATAGD